MTEEQAANTKASSPVAAAPEVVQPAPEVAQQAPAAPEEQIKAFSLHHKIAEGLSMDADFATELAKNVSLPDEQKLSEHFKESGFNQKQIDFVSELTESVAKVAGLAREGVERAEQERMKTSFQSTIKEEYGNSGKEQVESAMLAWLDDHGLKTEILGTLSPKEHISLAKRILRGDTAPTGMISTEMAQPTQTSPDLESIIKIRGIR